MDAALLVVFIVVVIAAAAVAARIAWEGRNGIGGRRANDDAPGGWFGSE